MEELEEQQQAMQLQRAEQRRGRARADDDEAFGPAEAAVSAVLGVLSRGGTPVAAAAAGEAAATAAEATAGGAELPVELDEFGRDVNAERKYAAAERARQRGAKLAELQARLAADPAMDQGEPRLGEESSDEEDEDDGERWAARQVEVQEAAAAVFRDAADEYASLGAVKRQLEEWKAQQPTSYRDAYVSLSAPAIFAPFVRLELLAWQPLAGGPSFDAQAWYRDLFDFGQPQDPSAADPEDPDNDLVPQLVAKLVLPLARHQLAEVWRPHSVRESAAAATLLSDLLVYLPPEDPGLRETLELVQVRLEGAVEGARLPPWPPAALAACPRAAALLAARFGRSVRLLRAACAFAPVLPRGWLQRLVLERLLAAQLLPYARSASGNLPAAADRASRLAEALLSTWFAAGTLPPRGAEGLVELLSNLARSTAAAAGEAGARAANTAAARQLAAALHRLGQPKAANEVAKAYGVL